MAGVGMAGAGMAGVGMPGAGMAGAGMMMMPGPMMGRMMGMGVGMRGNMASNMMMMMGGGYPMGAMAATLAGPPGPSAAAGAVSSAQYTLGECFAARKPPVCGSLPATVRCADPFAQLNTGSCGWFKRAPPTTSWTSFGRCCSRS